jgi:5'-3' exonuclease
MRVHLIDGTYELFRHYYALPKVRDRTGQEVAAVRGVLASLIGMLGTGVTHIGVATDHVIESFRNDLWPGYKTGEGIEPDLFAQFPLLEEALSALGIVVWPMVEFEADDALAAAATAAANEPRVEQVIICTPDKDLAQCVRGTRVVQLDRRKNLVRDEAGVIAQIRRDARLHSGLSCPGGRFGGRFSRTAGLGRQIGCCRARKIQPYRVHSLRLASMGRQRCQSQSALQQAHRRS